MARRGLTLLAACLLLAGFLLAAIAMPGVARADGDPASDVLLGENVFYPYSPTVSSAIQKTLNAETAAASKAHFPIKVALIGSPIDLGVIPELFGKPQRYANFLEQEISFQGPQPLLVVMATGYGVKGFAGPATSAIGLLAKPVTGQPNDLARAAITAVAKLANASGHPIKGVSGVPGAAGAGGGGGSQGLIVAILALAAIATAATLVVLRRRQAAVG